MSKKLYIVVNQDWFFLSHRFPIGKAAVEAGYDVTVITEDTGVSDKIRAAGMKAVDLPIEKAGANLRNELKTFRFLLKVFREGKPDIVHLVGLKLILWGSIARLLAGVRSMVCAICGLGILFDDEHRRSLITRGTMAVLRLTLRRKHTVCIFQNDDDQDLFLRERIVRKAQCYQTKGSGIDLDDYGYKEEPAAEPLKVIFSARMVETKGIRVLIKAAEKLRGEYEGKVLFELCGGTDPNPESMTAEELRKISDGHYITWLGHCSNMKQLLEEAHVMAFPSWYREGLPKAVIEAEAIGRPVITTDSVGCRDTVIDGYNGIIIAPRNAEALADALRRLIDDGELRQQMGHNARRFAEDNFSISEVVRIHLHIYSALA